MVLNYPGRPRSDPPAAARLRAGNRDSPTAVGAPSPDGTDLPWAGQQPATVPAALSCIPPRLRRTAEMAVIGV